MKYTIIFFSLLFVISSQAATFTMALPDENYPPFHFIKGEQHLGIISDVISRFAQQAGFKLDYVMLPKIRSQKMLDEQLIDARIESTHWYRGENNYFWSSEIVQVEDVALVSEGVELADLTALNGYVFAARFGYIYPSIEHAIKQGKLHRENFYDEVHMLNSIAHGEGKRFTILANASFNWYRKHYENFNELKVSEVNVGIAPLQLQFSYTPHGQELAKQFNQFLIELKSSGELAKIINTYQ